MNSETTTPINDLEAWWVTAHAMRAGVGPEIVDSFEVGTYLGALETVNGLVKNDWFNIRIWHYDGATQKIRAIEV